MSYEGVLAENILPEGASWLGRLSLEFVRRGTRTIVARRRHQGPLLVQRAFHEPDGTCQVYLIHPPGGVVGGDALEFSFDVDRGARALVTTPGATKLYNSPRRGSRLELEVRSSSGATFEWLPQETIVFTGVQAHSESRVRLDAGSHFIGWDITCLGQDNRGLAQGHFTQVWRVERDGRLLWTERAEYVGGSVALTAPWGLAGRTVVGTLIATGAGALDVDAVREACPDSERDWLSTSRLGDVLLCRYLGYSAEAAKGHFQTAWGVLRRRLFGRDACPPRVWAT
jgi:urease accessory protein